MFTGHQIDVRHLTAINSSQLKQISDTDYEIQFSLFSFSLQKTVNI